VATCRHGLRRAGTAVRLATRGATLLANGWLTDTVTTFANRRARATIFGAGVALFTLVVVAGAVAAVGLIARRTFATVRSAGVAVLAVRAGANRVTANHGGWRRRRAHWDAFAAVRGTHRAVFFRFAGGVAAH